MKKARLPILAIVVASIFAASCQNAAAPLSTGATLSALSLSANGAGVSLSPSFASATTSYSANVATSVASVTVAATSTDSSATLSGIGSTSLSVGANTLSVVVTAADGATKGTYSIVVNRGPSSASSDATLSALTLSYDDSSIALNSYFSGGTSSYTARIPNSRASIVVRAAPRDSNASASISVGDVPIPVTLISTDGSKTPTFKGTASLAEGANVISVVVTAADGTTKQSYTITATRVAPGLSSDATFAISLAASGSPIPLASDGEGESTARVANSITSVVVAITATDPGAIVLGNGTVSLSTGVNMIRVVVTAADGTANRLDILVTRVPIAAQSDYVGTWIESSGSTIYSMTIGLDGSVSYSATNGAYVVTNTGTVAVNAASGLATISNHATRVANSYLYDSAAGTLDTLDDNFYRRVSGDPSSLAGEWATTGGYYTLSIKADHTLIAAYNGTTTSSGSWNDSTIAFLYDDQPFAYTANVDLTATPSTISESSHSRTLVKQ